MYSRTFQYGFRKIIAWQEAHKMTLLIYRVTQKFPSHETYGITSQLRRASSSVAAQIVEGSRMHTAPHRSIFYERSYASAAEVDYFLELAKDLGYLDAKDFEICISAINRTSYLIQQLSASLQK
jgi:four helix bundle protein